VAYWRTAPDGARLRAAWFPMEDAPRGTVVLSPGRTEPIEKYFEVVEDLRSRGFGVLVHDWRGQGRSHRALSDPMLGHARGWRPFLADFDSLLTLFAPEMAQPWIGLGHSMGGGLTALALAEGETRFSAAVLCAPMLGVATGRRTLASVERLCFLMNFLGRGKTLVDPSPAAAEEAFEGNVLTHDRRRWERVQAQLKADPDLRLGGVTWGWLAFALTLARRVAASRRIDSLSIPVAVIAAGEEKLVVNAASKAFAGRIKNGVYIEIPGANHEILMETDDRRAEFWAAFDAVADRAAPRAPA
jgi:lysophospholipase